MIHAIKQDNGDIHYCISAYQVWRPGSFDSERTARIAQRCTDELIDVASHLAKQSRGIPIVITEADLQQAKKQDREPAKCES